MPILHELKEMLDGATVPYEIFNHPLAYTSEEIAATHHVSGNEIAKVENRPEALGQRLKETTRRFNVSEE
jgi:hypothetical protein